MDRSWMAMLCVLLLVGGGARTVSDAADELSQSLAELADRQVLESPETSGTSVQSTAGPRVRAAVLCTSGEGPGDPVVWFVAATWVGPTMWPGPDEGNAPGEACRSAAGRGWRCLPLVC